MARAHALCILPLFRQRCLGDGQVIRGFALNEHYDGDVGIIFKHAYALGCEGIVSKRRGSLYRAGRSIIG